MEEYWYSYEEEQKLLDETYKKLKKIKNGLKKIFPTEKEKIELKEKRAKDRIRSKLYYQKNKFHLKIKFAERRRKLENIIHDFTEEEWNKKVINTKGICPVCNRPYEDGFGLTLDHEPPISKVPDGFVYTIDNVSPMCKSCNSSKSNN